VRAAAGCAPSPLVTLAYLGRGDSAAGDMVSIKHGGLAKTTASRRQSTVSYEHYHSQPFLFISVLMLIWDIWTRWRAYAAFRRVVSTGSLPPLFGLVSSPGSSPAPHSPLAASRRATSVWADLLPWRMPLPGTALPGFWTAWFDAACQTTFISCAAFWDVCSHASRRAHTLSPHHALPHLPAFCLLPAPPSCLLLLSRHRPFDLVDINAGRFGAAVILARARHTQRADVSPCQRGTDGGRWAFVDGWACFALLQRRRGSQT